MNKLMRRLATMQQAIIPNEIQALPDSPKVTNKAIQFNFNIASVIVIKVMKNLVLFLMKLAISNKNVTNTVSIVNGTGNDYSPILSHFIVARFALYMEGHELRHQSPSMQNEGQQEVHRSGYSEQVKHGDLQVRHCFCTVQNEPLGHYS